MKSTGEAAVLKAVLQYLALRRVPAWRANSGAVAVGEGAARRFVRFNGAPGCSDVLGLVPPGGRFLAVEVKRPGGRVTPAQRSFLDMVRDAGGLALVVHSVQELEAALRDAGLA